MKSLSEAPEHDKGLWWEGPGSDRAVWTLIAARRTLAAETPTWKLPTRPSITTHAWHTPALPPVKLTSVTWRFKKKKKNSLFRPLLDLCTTTLSENIHNDTGKPKMSESVKITSDSVWDHQNNWVRATGTKNITHFPEKKSLLSLLFILFFIFYLHKKITNNIDQNYIILLHLQS